MSIQNITDKTYIESENIISAIDYSIIRKDFTISVGSDDINCGDDYIDEIVDELSQIIKNN